MKPKYWTILILASAAIITSLLYYLRQPAPYSGPVVVPHVAKTQSQATTTSLTPLTDVIASTSPATSSPTTQTQTDTSGWKTYTNSQYGFTFEYPKDGFVDSTSDPSHGYIRIQNYTAIGDNGLAKNQFYLEISILDANKGDQISKDCSQLFDSVDKQWTPPGANVYLGYPTSGGDSGGIQYASCISRADSQVFIQITESDQESSIAHSILNSLTLGNTK